MPRLRRPDAADLAAVRAAGARVRLSLLWRPRDGQRRLRARGCRCRRPDPGSRASRRRGTDARAARHRPRHRAVLGAGQAHTGPRHRAGAQRDSLLPGLWRSGRGRRADGRPRSWSARGSGSPARSSCPGASAPPAAATPRARGRRGCSPPSSGGRVSSGSGSGGVPPSGSGSGSGSGWGSGVVDMGRRGLAAPARRGAGSASGSSPVAARRRGGRRRRGLRRVGDRDAGVDARPRRRARPVRWPGRACSA